MRLQAVPDTNVVIARQNAGEGSPNKEFFERWERDEFSLLYSDDTLLEYIEKLLEWKVSRERIVQLMTAIRRLGVYVQIQFYHLDKYPNDKDDIPFLLCAANGGASHLVSYDRHLLVLNNVYEFKICPTLEFLFELRQTQKKDRENDSGRSN